MNLKKMDTEVLVEFADILAARMDRMVQLCTTLGIDLDKYTVFSEDADGEVNVDKAPIPNYKELQKYIDSGKAKSSLPVIVGGMAELSDILISIISEVDKRK